MDGTLNFELRYVGARFEGTKLPLDVLDDLPAFRDLVAAFARQRWLTLYADRQRVPKGFSRSLSFDLIGMRDGSAIPILKWDRAAAQLRLPDFADELEGVVNGAYQDAVSLVAGAAEGAFPKALPPEQVSALNRFGSALRDDERIEFLGSKAKDGNVVYLDLLRRKALITKVRETYIVRYEGAGVLVGTHAPAGQTEGSITVETEEYGPIAIHLDAERVLKQFDGHLQQQVQFEVDLELDNLDKLRNVHGVHDAVLVDERFSADLERCRMRIEEISNLTDGWDGEGSVAIASSARAAALEFVRKRPVCSGRYKIFPTAVGGILIEFEAAHWDMSVEFAPNGSLDFFGIEVDGDGEIPPIHFDGVNADFTSTFDKYVSSDG